MHGNSYSQTLLIQTAIFDLYLIHMQKVCLGFVWSASTEAVVVVWSFKLKQQQENS